MFKVITPEGLKKLDTWKYTGTAPNWVDTTLMQPWWNFVASVMPRWLAPNLITLMGNSMNTMACVLTLHLCPDLVCSGPRWLYFVLPLLNFGWQTLDAVDGKHRMSLERARTDLLSSSATFQVLAGEVQERQKDSRQVLDREVLKLNATLATTSKRLFLLERENASLKTQTTTTRATHVNIEGRLGALESENNDLRTRNLSLEGALATLLETVDAHAARLAAAERGLGESELEASELRARLAGAKEHIASFGAAQGEGKEAERSLAATAADATVRQLARPLTNSRTCAH